MPDIHLIESILLWAFFIYMLVTTIVYLLLNGVAFNTLMNYMEVKRDDDDELMLTGSEPPISILIPSVPSGRYCSCIIRSSN